MNIKKKRNMKAKCIECNLHWNISIKKKIYKKGYICPKCIAKMKEGSASGRKLESITTSHMRRHDNKESVKVHGDNYS